MTRSRDTLLFLIQYACGQELIYDEIRYRFGFVAYFMFLLYLGLLTYRSILYCMMSIIITAVYNNNIIYFDLGKISFTANEIQKHDN